MIRTTLNWTVKNLKSMNDDRHTLDFSHPIQRQSGQWDGDRLNQYHRLSRWFVFRPIRARSRHWSLKTH